MTEKDTFPYKIQKLQTIYHIAVEMNKPHSTKELLDLILTKCLALTKATSGSVMLIDYNNQVLNIANSKGIRKEITKKTKLKLGEGITGWVAKTGNPKLVNNILLDPLYVSVRKDIEAELAVPIKTDETIIGVISVDSKKKNAFTGDDLELLMMIAELAAQIFIQDSIKEAIESKLKSQEVLINIFHFLETETDLDKLFQAIMDTLKKNMKILRGMLVLFDDNSKTSLSIKAGYKISDEAMRKGIYKIGEGIIGQAVLEGKTIIVKDIAKEPKFLNKMKIKRAGEGSVAFIAAPIKIGQKSIGVLAIEKKVNKQIFLDDISHTMTILTSLISYKIKNYNEEQTRTKQLLDENLQLRQALGTEYTTKSIIGKSPAIRKTLETLPLIANAFAPILITGETGTGKELIAKAIHFLSHRKNNKFVSINCSAIPENLLEAELFGYVKGAFTGAVNNKKGKFELAHKGTLFLDEIGDMPLGLQAKILRVIQEKEIEPLGSEITKKIDLHIIAATNKNLEDLVEKKEFRADLFFRLNVIPLHIPPLRERKEDILLLTHYFIQKYNKLYKKNMKYIDFDVENIFLNYPWPGNVRELEHVIERVIILTPNDQFSLSLLPDSFRQFQKAATTSESLLETWIDQKIKNTQPSNIYETIMNDLDKLLIEKILIQNNYNKSKTAEILGINRNTLKSKIQKQEIL